MRALIAIAVAGCTGSQTECERTGVCVTVEVGGLPVEGPVPLVVGKRFQPPVTNATAISSSFGPRWKTSASRDDFHLGIDYFGEPGTPLLAIGDGVVAGIYPEGNTTFPNGGNVVVIEHVMPETTFHGVPIDRVFAIYLHVQSFAVAAGEPVVAGQTVAAMGMTGDTEFVHLHFETRVGTQCSQLACGGAFDPHVHPFLFVSAPDDDVIEVQPLGGDGFGVRFIEHRGDLDFDVIESDLGALGFDERRGIDVKHLDDFDYGWIRLVPQPFSSTSTDRVFDLHFDERPSWLELRDIHGRGIRF